MKIIKVTEKLPPPPTKTKLFFRIPVKTFKISAFNCIGCTLNRIIRARCTNYPTTEWIDSVDVPLLQWASCPRVPTTDRLLQSRTYPSARHWCQKCSHLIQGLRYICFVGICIYCKLTNAWVGLWRKFGLSFFFIRLVHFCFTKLHK